MHETKDSLKKTTSPKHAENLQHAQGFLRKSSFLSFGKL